jgi:hypothetical protein
VTAGSTTAIAVRLDALGNGLMVGRTCIAAIQATGNPAGATLSISGLWSEDLRDVIVDGNGGKAAARDCISRLECGGRRVRTSPPPNGLNFNDRCGSGRALPPPSAGRSR